MKHTPPVVSGNLPPREGFSTLITLLLLTLGQICPTASGQALPGISELLRQVEAATLPPQAYTATVHQSVLKTNTAAVPHALALKPRLTEEEDFTVAGTRSGLVHASKPLAARRYVENTNASAAASGDGVGAAAANATVSSVSDGSAVGNARLVMTMNPINALRYMDKTGSATIADGSDNGSPCYEVSAPCGRFGFRLWVTKDSPRVTRQLLLLDGEPVYDTTFEYKKWSGVLVPSHVVISHPGKGVRIDQQFSAHSTAAAN